MRAGKVLIVNTYVLDDDDDRSESHSPYMMCTYPQSTASSSGPIQGTP